PFPRQEIPAYLDDRCVRLGQSEGCSLSQNPDRHPDHPHRDTSVVSLRSKSESCRMHSYSNHERQAYSAFHLALCGIFWLYGKSLDTGSRVAQLLAVESSMKPCISRLVQTFFCFLFTVALAFGGAGDAKFAKKTVRADDGLNIVCDVGGKGDTALIFLHGWCGDREYWKHQVN